MENLYLAILLWLAVGFIMGIKVIFVDQGLDLESVKNMDTKGMSIEKPFFLMVCTVLGFITLFVYIAAFYNVKIKGEKK